MTTPFESAVLLTVRGTFIPQTLDATRDLHNATAGSEQGIAAARSLGDLSHNVYAPLARGAAPVSRELLFLDWWEAPDGIMQFFSDKQVQEQGAKLFSERDATVWMPARGSSSWVLPAPKANAARYIGLIRGTVASPEQALGTFAGIDTKAQRDARRRGLLSHQLFVKAGAPGEVAAPEVLGLDVWCDLDGMNEHYSDASHMGGLAGVFAGAPQSSVWQQPEGHWSEW